MRIEVTVNGAERQLEVEPRLLLVDLLRDRLHLTGTHLGCEDGKCGACTISLDGQPVKSCMVLAAQVDGGEIVTVEGLADGVALSPLQRAFQEHHALQCGFCTPGFLIAARGLLERNPDPTEEEVRRGLAGNLCRCTGYTNIVRAVRAAAEAMRGEATRPSPEAMGVTQP
ncbi:MAG TPA: (2Fe-2S)-binding protein [Candidatus Dormibacteraeota bacterium]|nr:(2Fe-2S)-binding protein [Candidatus Dormibacteraeota bacterium]